MPAGREDEAVRFYAGVLDLEHVPKPDHLASRGGCWFRSGPVELHLGVEDGFRPARKAHPALLVANLPVLRARLEAEGVELAVDTQIEGRDRFYVSDPFGNRLELIGEG